MRGNLAAWYSVSFLCLSVTCKDGRDGSKPVSFSLLEKERFLEFKEKGAPVWVEWSQIGIRRPVFTPPLRSSSVYRRLRRRNWETLWFYPHFFRRLRRWVSGRGAAARYSLYRGARLHLSSLFTLHFSLLLLLVGRDDLGAPDHTVGRPYPPPRPRPSPFRHRAQAFPSPPTSRAVIKFFLGTFSFKKKYLGCGGCGCGGRPPGA